jgi:hypothetical protein
VAAPVACVSGAAGRAALRPGGARREASALRFILFLALRFVHLLQRSQAQKKFGCMVTPRKKRPKRNESEALAVGDQDCGSLGAEQRR